MKAALWKSVKDIIETALAVYRLPRLEGQSNYVEVWCEKSALAGILEPIANRFHVVLMINRGYSSQSAMYEAACRIDNACRRRYPQRTEGMISAKPTILYFGDFDPSGEDMVRDISDRLNMFLAGYLTDEESSGTSNRISPAGWNTGVVDSLEVEVKSWYNDGSNSAVWATT